MKMLSCAKHRESAVSQKRQQQQKDAFPLHPKLGNTGDVLTQTLRAVQHGQFQFKLFTFGEEMKLRWRL